MDLFVWTIAVDVFDIFKSKSFFIYDYDAQTNS